jgi:hypothetical protein
MSGGSIMKNGMRSREIVLCCYVLLAGLTLLFGAASARAGAITDFGPLPNSLPVSDDGSSGAVDIAAILGSVLILLGYNFKKMGDRGTGSV